MTPKAGMCTSMWITATRCQLYYQKNLRNKNTYIFGQKREEKNKNQYYQNLSKKKKETRINIYQNLSLC